MRRPAICVLLFCGAFFISSPARALTASDFNSYPHLGVELEFKGTGKFFSQYHIFYKGYQGEKVPALLNIPVSNPFNSRFGPPWPCVFFMHFHVSDKNLVNLLAHDYAKFGIATFAIDGVFKGERYVKGKDILAKEPSESFINMNHQIFDILKGFDLLTKIPEVDQKKMGFIGVSMGAITGAVAVALDPRISVIVLADGGGNLKKMFELSDYGDIKDQIETLQKAGMSFDEVSGMMNLVDPVYYASRLGDRPVLMINGKKDTTIPVPCIEALYDAIPSKNKQIKWYNTGHILPPDGIKMDSWRWFAKYFLGVEDIDAVFKEYGQYLR